jgi:hypothetical protein
MLYVDIQQVFFYSSDIFSFSSFFSRLVVYGRSLTPSKERKGVLLASYVKLFVLLKPSQLKPSPERMEAEELPDTTLI